MARPDDPDLGVQHNHSAGSLYCPVCMPRDADGMLPRIAAILKAHFPKEDATKHEIVCCCGWKAHFIDAKAWHRHAAAMVWNELIAQKDTSALS